MHDWHEGRMDANVDSAPVTVHAVAENFRPVVERLAQLERHDLSEFRGYTLGADTLTRGLPDGATSIVAFFIVRALRKQGVGHRAAQELLRTQPGRWAIAFQEENVGVPRFWRHVATATVGFAWREEQQPTPPSALPGTQRDTWLFLDTTAASG